MLAYTDYGGSGYSAGCRPNHNQLRQIQLGVNPQAIAVVTALAGSVAFITPLAHPVNLIMIAPANYSFQDFVRSGWIFNNCMFCYTYDCRPIVLDIMKYLIKKRILA